MSSTEDLLQRYNSEINHFVNWCTENYLEINVNKTKELVIYFRKRGTPIPALTINGRPIERVSEYKYLGTVIDDKLSLIKTQVVQLVNYVNVCIFSESLTPLA